MDIRAAVAEWPIALVNEVLDDWDLFEQEGSIGDCALRCEARAFARPTRAAVVHVMRDVAFECYRRLAKEKWP